jgi:hypothetical protein
MQTNDRRRDRPSAQHKRSRPIIAQAISEHDDGREARGEAIGVSAKGKVGAGRGRMEKAGGDVGGWGGWGIVGSRVDRRSSCGESEEGNEGEGEVKHDESADGR